MTISEIEDQIAVLDNLLTDYNHPYADDARAIRRMLVLLIKLLQDQD